MQDDVTIVAPHAGETIRVELGERSYDIVIGEHLLDAAGGFVASTLPNARCAVVSDATVAALYLGRLKASLGQLFLGEIVVAPGEQSKNLLVLADFTVLATLAPREFRAGYAEVVKYGLLGDAPFFVWLEENWPQIFSGTGPARASAIATSLRAKVAIVEADEREESGTRALLNLGHTFGHALEAYAGYSDRLLHGEAIAIGMRLAFTFSAEQRLCPAGDAERVERHLAAVGLPTRITDIPGPPSSPERLLELMAQDKKVKTGRLALVLVHGIGQAFVERDVMDLTAFLARECAGR